MPRAFTDTERSAIRERLIATGQSLFARRGIRATTVEQLAREAGISKGAFYFFYPSKEALFFAIVEQVEEEIQSRLLDQVTQNPRDALRLLLRFSLSARDENPLFDVATSEEAVAVMRTMSAEEQEQFLRRDIEMTTTLAKRLDAAGVEVAASPALLAGLLRALVFVGMHREDIGIEVAPAVEDFLVETIAGALGAAPHSTAEALAGEAGKTGAQKAIPTRAHGRRRQ
jgi:AcrR family transcriptional regulator